MNRLFPLFILVSALAGCNNSDLKTAASEVAADSITSVEARFIQPPLKGVDVPYQPFSFVAEQGDTLFPTSGSILCFPAGSIVDKNGMPIKGKVDIIFREFMDPVDFFLSGIPMDYQQHGRKYIFESSAMCELKAYQNGVPVFVHQQKKPEVHLVTKNKDTTHNLYRLDTVRREWVVKGKDAITDLKRKGEEGDRANIYDYMATSDTILSPMEMEQLPARIKPLKASGNRPVILIDIAPGSVPELMNFNNLKFEIAEEDKNWDQKYSSYEWSDIELEQTKTTGLYQAKFSRYGEKVVFLVRPVLEGKDYDEAVKAIEDKKKESQNLKTARIAGEEKARKLSAREEKRQAQESKAQLTKERKEFEANENIIREKNKRIEELNALIIKRKQERQINKQNAVATETIFRSFEIDGFGIWNCDEPVLREAFPLFARFKDKTGKEIRLSRIAVIYKNFNGISWYANLNIMLLPDTEQMIWGICDDKLVVLSYADFKKCGIKRDVVEYTFTMEVKEMGKDGYESLKRML